jgi:hypothetical protein
MISIQSFLPNPLSYARSFQLVYRVATDTSNRYMTSSSRVIPVSGRNATRTSTASSLGSKKMKTKKSTSSSGDKVTKGDDRRNSRRGMHHHRHLSGQIHTIKVTMILKALHILFLSCHHTLAPPKRGNDPGLYGTVSYTMLL